jgi:hypothetical protein
MSSSEYDIERSLLQKAIRRGNEDLTAKVIKYLKGADNDSWLRKRLFVIAYEECWTIGNQLTATNLTEDYKKIARSVKNKNVAGLAALASEYRKGNNGLLDGIGIEEKDNIKSIANAIDTPKQFWNFIRDLPGYQGNYNRIESAIEATAKASFEHDKLLMYAATCLIAENQIPETQFADPTNEHTFPYWVAFDKHTDAGRDIIIRSSNRIKLDSYKGGELAFYFEGSLCNQIVDSPYWEHLKKWKIGKLGFNLYTAQQKWEELKPVVIELTKKRAGQLKEKIEEATDSEPSLFS